MCLLLSNDNMESYPLFTHYATIFKVLSKKRLTDTENMLIFSRFNVFIFWGSKLALQFTFLKIYFIMLFNYFYNK
jgi:hypothetical protein